MRDSRRFQVILLVLSLCLILISIGVLVLGFYPPPRIDIQEALPATLMAPP